MPQPSATEKMPRRTGAIVTVPNLLCAIRFFGAPFLLLLAWQDQPTAFVVWFLLLAVTDWIDGKLAILLDQRSVFGTRFDSTADVTLYLCLLLGALVLRGSQLVAEWPWIAAVAISYAVAGLVSLIRFGCWPSYHTRMAKTSWLFTLIGAGCFLMEWSPWPLRFAMAWVTLTNCESILISLVLPRSDINVSSLFAARKQRASQGRSADDAASVVTEASELT